MPSFKHLGGAMAVPSFMTVVRDLGGQWHVACREFSRERGLAYTVGETVYETLQAAQEAAEVVAQERRFLHIPYDGAVVTVIPVGEELYMPVILNAEGRADLQGEKALPFGDAGRLAKQIAEQKKLISLSMHRA